MKKIVGFGVIVMFVVFFTQCKRDQSEPDFKAFPKEIGNIMITQCAITGCHNSTSRIAAGGLNLESWDAMFEGSSGGSAVVPFNAEQSFLNYFINTYDDLGQQLNPVMPFNSAPLSRSQVQLFTDWINEGAPDANGFVKFSDNPNRRKVYNVNQGCDFTVTIDPATGVIMRYISVGSDPNQIESPHQVKVSPDGKYWYVIFTAGTTIQKYRTSDDQLVGEANIGPGNWNTFSITQDGSTAYIVDFAPSGTVVQVNLNNMTVTLAPQLGLFQPHGSALGPNDQFLYIASQIGNFVNKLDLNDAFSNEQISLETGAPPSSLSSLDPHEVFFHPDGSKYYLSCQKSNEVRVMQTSNDSLLAVIAVGGFPQEFSFSTSKNLLFVTCMEDLTTFPGVRGSVAIIDTETSTFVKAVHTGPQPHGVAVDEFEGVVWVSNRNASSDGPAPHHISDCGGRNGSMAKIDLNTLEVDDNYKWELSVDPYAISVRN